MSAAHNLSDQQISFLRTELEKRKTKLKRRVDRLRHEELPAQSRDEKANDNYGDDAKSEQIVQRTTNMLRHYYERLEQVDHALVRIENGTYGIDRQTGEPIAFERLAVHPTAQEAIEP